MMGKMKIALALVAAFPAACVSMGTNYDLGAVERLQVGMSKAEVIAQLGRPTSTATLPDGRQQLSWTYSRGDMLGRASGRSLILMFDVAGRYAGLVAQAETTLR